MEVPEIYDGTVVIKSAVREPGERAKIAVMSNERDVDPVGACVGMKGSRVQAIIRELRGEKIDIIEWSDEPSVFAANALSPAKVNQVRITDIENRQMEVIVNEDQLSLAIGKRGQNVRLATKLVGWNIDIRSEEEIKREVTEQMGALIASGEAVPLSAIEGVTAQQAEALAEHGINDIDALAQTIRRRSGRVSRPEFGRSRSDSERGASRYRVARSQSCRLKDRRRRSRPEEQLMQSRPSSMSRLKLRKSNRLTR